MKTDLLTSIGAGVAGAVVAFLICNAFMGEITSVRFKVLEKGVDVKMVEPDSDIFNFRALNPTVEVFVGECEQTDEVGNCVTKKASDSTEENQSETPAPVEQPKEE